MESSNDYGWKTAEHPNSCDYLGNEIIDKLRVIRPESVLDLGCGNGALCSLIHENFKDIKIVGVDYDEQGVRLASEQYPSIEFYNYGVQDEPADLISNAGGLFDVVVSTEVVEHLYEPRLLTKYASGV